MKRMMTLASTLLALAACSETADVAEGKGPESALPSMDSKDDSFRKPTEHGTLAFGIKSQTALSDEAQFHAWDFTLTGEATISLTVDAYTPNLDTVMYLYRRDAGTEYWGGHIERNDDASKSLLSSRIEGTFGAGEYRVLVKGYKLSIAGDFALAPECEGDGCRADDGEQVADYSLPVATDFTVACSDTITNIISSPLMSTDAYGIHYETEAGALPTTLRIAVEFYRQYMEDFDYWNEDWFEDGHRLDVEAYLTEDGSVVSVDFQGGDETTLTFVFNGKDELLSLFHDEQSPTLYFYCGEGVKAELDAPSEDCYSAYVTQFVHDQDGEAELNGTASVGDLKTDTIMDTMVAQAVTAYAQQQQLDDTAEVTFSGAHWESANWGHGAYVTVEAEGKARITYEVGYSEYGPNWVFTASDENSRRYVCTSKY